MYCRNCGAEIGVDMNFCPSCGFSVDGGGRTAANSQTNIMINHKSEGITILLSVIITGAGHMCAGKVKEGIILLALQIVLSIVAVSMFVTLGAYGSVFGFIISGVASLISIIIWLYAIIDSNKVVKEYNARLVESGNPPW